MVLFDGWDFYFSSQRRGGAGGSGVLRGISAGYFGLKFPPKITAKITVLELRAIFISFVNVDLGKDGTHASSVLGGGGGKDKLNRWYFRFRRLEISTNGVTALY